MKSFINFLKGIAISISTLVPGVSGGTMAIILGVYDDLIHAIGSFFDDWRKHTYLLLQIGLGGLLGLVAFTPILEKTFKTYPIEMGFLFIGVVLGGVPVLYKRATAVEKNKLDLIYLFLGLIVATFMASKPESVSSMATTGGSTGFIFLIIAGIIIAVALILPGISGSFMLLILGLYDVTLRAINERNITYLIPLGIGLVIGTLSTTKIIEKLLKKYPGKTYMLILGFVLGSIIPIYPGMPSGGQFISSLLVMIGGLSFILWIGKKEF